MTYGYTSPSQFIVGTGPNCNYKTITLALAAATSGNTVYVSSGTYTENFTIPAGVNLTALSISYEVPVVNVIGTMTMTATGTSSVSNIAFQTNGAACIVVSGANACVLNMEDVYLKITNANGISFTNSNASSNISWSLGTCDINTTGITLFTSSSPGNINIFQSLIGNSGSSITSSSLSAGQALLENCQGSINFATSNSAFINMQFCNWSTNNQPLCALTGTSLFQMEHCSLNTGNAAIATIAAGCTAGVDLCRLTSSAANVFTGSGTLNYGLLNYATNFGMSVTTQNQLLSSEFHQVNIQTFSGSGTYTPTSGMKYCIIEAIGGGGGGGGGAATNASVSAGSGGASGSYVRGFYSAASIGASQAVTIGAAGAGAAAGSNNGTAGGNTIVGALITSTGGNPGFGTVAGVFALVGGGQGSTASTGGSIQQAGNAGASSFAIFGAALSAGTGGQGGASFLGGGPSSPGASTSTTLTFGGVPASGFGAGGTGGFSLSCAGATAAAAGGNGGGGVVIITEYI